MPSSFSTNWSQKSKKEPFSLCSGDIWGLTNGSEKRLEQHFGGFYLMNKRAPANRKKGFHTIRPLKNLGIKGIFVFSSKAL
jgi:hypothetical protein